MNSQELPLQNKMLDLTQFPNSMINNANFGVIVVDNSLSIQYCNQAACEILGHPTMAPESFLKQALSHLFQGDAEALQRFLESTKADNSPSTVEIQSEKGTKNLELCANNVLGPEGTQEGIIFSISDSALIKKENHLEQENLRLSIMESLASEMAHELKNPVTVIKGFSQLLLNKTYEDPQVTDFLEIITKEAERANFFIQDFFNLVRTKESHKRIIKPRHLITDAMAEIERHCFLNEIEIIQQIETSKTILGDYKQLKEVLVNLGKNGIEAMAETETPKILTFSLTGSDDSNSIIIKVKDTGCGMTPEVEDKILTPFFTTKKHGTGLGLSITKTIIDRHGGTLSFSSGPEGTTATVELP